MKRPAVWFGAGLIVVLAVAVGVSQLASDQPDGLEFVAEQEGFAGAADDHSLSEAPLADYGGDSRRNLALSGLLGVAVTLGIGFGVFWLVRRTDRGGDAAETR